MTTTIPHAAALAPRDGLVRQQAQIANRWGAVTLGLLIFMAAELSRLLSVDVANMSAIWPPLGIAVGASLVLRGRAVLSYAAALSGWLVWHDYDNGIVLVVVAEQSLQCALAGYFLRRYLTRPRLLASLQDTLRFYFWAPFAALLPISLLAALLLYGQGLFGQFRLLDFWLVYWMSEALGVLLFAPLAEQLFRTALQGDSLPRPSVRTLAFAGALAILMALTAMTLVAGQYEYGKVMTYLYFPLLAAAAMSGQRWLSLVAVPLVSMSVLAFVVLSIRLLDAPAAFLLVEALMLIFLMTIMSQLVQAASTEREKLSRKFREQASRDHHTGMLNDRALLANLSEVEPHADTQHLVGVLEIQNFAEAQDGLDMGFARHLEIHVGVRIGALDGVSGVARLSAGSYGFHWAGMDIQPIVAQLKTLVRDLQGYAYSEGDSVYVLRVAAGAIQRSSGDAPEALLSAAGQAARHAARHIDQPFFLCRLDDAFITSRQQKLSRLEEIKDALGDNRFLLYCQEVRPVAPRENGVSAYEILVRMLDAEGRLVAPGAFLPVAQDYGLVGQIDRWVVAHSFRWLHETPGWQARVSRFAINLSGATLADPDFPDWVGGLLQRYPVRPDQIGFEVTESQQIHDWAMARQLLERLRQAGFTIYLDDFGTGLATFDYLISFPFDVLKIDGLFIRGISQSKVNQTVVASITDVARVLGLRTVAEFVEDSVTAELLTDLGVDYLQGYGIARPVPLSTLLTPT